MRSLHIAAFIAMALVLAPAFAAPASPAPAIPQTPDGISGRLIQNGFTRASSQSLHIGGAQFATYFWRNEAEHAVISASFKNGKLQGIAITITNPADHCRTTTGFDAEGKVTGASVSRFE